MNQKFAILSASVAMTLSLMPLTAFAHGGALGSGNSHAGRGGQASQEISHGKNHSSSATNNSNTGNSQKSARGNTSQGASHGNNPQSSHNAQATKTNTFVRKNKGLVNQLASIQSHPAILTLPSPIKNNKTVKSLLTTNQQLQHTIFGKETVLKKDMQTLLSQLTSPSPNQLSSTSLQMVDQAVQKAVNLGKSLTARSNKGGMEKGLVRALAMLKANEAGMKQELSALTTAIQKIELLLKQTSPTTSVTSAVYGTNGSTNDNSSSTTTTSTSSSTL